MWTETERTATADVQPDGDCFDELRQTVGRLGDLANSDGFTSVEGVTSRAFVILHLEQLDGLRLLVR